MDRDIGRARDRAWGGTPLLRIDPREAPEIVAGYKTAVLLDGEEAPDLKIGDTFRFTGDWGGMDCTDDLAAMTFVIRWREEIVLRGNEVRLLCFSPVAVGGGACVRTGW